MPVFKGTTGLSAIYKGDTPISKIYKGSVLVFQSGGDVPEGYILPRVILDSENTNIQFSGNTTIGTTAMSRDSYVDGIYNNGLIDTTEDTTTTIFYVPSMRNNTAVVNIAPYSLCPLGKVYPNLTNIVLGEGLTTIGKEGLVYGANDYTNSTNKPKVMLPSTLDIMYRNAVYNVHIYSFRASDYHYYNWHENSYYTNETSTRALGSRFAFCEFDKVIADSYLFELDYEASTTPTDGGSSLLTNSGLGSNIIHDLTIDGISTIGVAALKKISIKEKLTFGSTITTIKNNAFMSGGFPSEITFPSNIQTIEYASFPLQTNKKLIFEHTNNDSIQFTLDSNNHGPFYYKTAYTLDIYTENSYILNYNWTTNENVTPTFYHLDGTPYAS